MSPTLAGGFSSTALPRKSPQVLFFSASFNIISGLVTGSARSASGHAELLLLVITLNPPSFRQREPLLCEMGSGW